MWVNYANLIQIVPYVCRALRRRQTGISIKTSFLNTVNLKMDTSETDNDFLTHHFNFLRNRHFSENKKLFLECCLQSSTAQMRVNRFSLNSVIKLSRGVQDSGKVRKYWEIQKL